MDRAGRISENEKWKAVVSCEKKYDGLFFYGVKTTGVFCRPSCKAKTPVRDNVVYFEYASDAIEQGFRPCKRCRPDKAVFEPDQEVLNKAEAIFKESFAGEIDMKKVAEQLGLSPGHLTRLFKKYLGYTPHNYIIRLRITKAVELLRCKDARILDIAYMTGFKSMSSFYKCFKEHMGYTPGKERECGGEVQ